jgi:ribonuclease BN (tRNA processing enzyme)
LARKLNHPQETFGYRLEHHGRVLAFTTDFEPYASGIPKAMIELVQNANVWIADCQYSRGDYTGEIRGVPKQGWGHAFPEAVAEIARVTHPGCIITTHHDPQSSDIEITGLARRVEEICGITTQAAYEGFTLDV